MTRRSALRDLAAAIIYQRKLLTVSAVLTHAGADDDTHERLQEHAELHWSLLHPALRYTPGVRDRITLPTERQIQREGITAAAARVAPLTATI